MQAGWTGEPRAARPAEPRYTPRTPTPSASREPPKLDLVARRHAADQRPPVARRLAHRRLGRPDLRPRGDPPRGRRHVRRRGLASRACTGSSSTRRPRPAASPCRRGSRRIRPMRPTRRPRRRSRRRSDRSAARIDRLATIRLVRAPGPAGRRSAASSPCSATRRGSPTTPRIVAGAWPDEVGDRRIGRPGRGQPAGRRGAGAAGRPAAPAGERHPARVVRPGPGRRRLRDRRSDRSRTGGPIPRCSRAS